MPDAWVPSRRCCSLVHACFLPTGLNDARYNQSSTRLPRPLFDGYLRSRHGSYALLSDHGITAKIAVHPALATEESVETVAADRQDWGAFVRPDLSDAPEKR